jgi:periplasmic copper chaperone A
MLRSTIAIGVALLLTGAAAHAQEFKSGGITIVTPWARATPGGAKVGGAYLQLKAATGTNDRLVAAKSPAAGAVEIHDHINEGGIMKMRRVDGIAVSGGQSVTLKPGGYHLMLMDLKQPLQQGGKLPLTLVFEKAGEIAVEATIAPIGAMGPAGDQGAPAKASGGHKH